MDREIRIYLMHVDIRKVKCKYILTCKTWVCAFQQHQNEPPYLSHLHIWVENMKGMQ